MEEDGKQWPFFLTGLQQCRILRFNAALDRVGNAV